MIARTRIVGVAAVLLSALVVAACDSRTAAGNRALGSDAFPELTRPVNDFAGVIDDTAARAMEAQIQGLQRDTGAVVIVATLRTCAPVTDIRACSMAVFENHGKGIGQRGKDNGVLLLLVLNDRQVRITTGYGLERVIPDARALEIVDEMTPSFRAARYGEGLRHGLDRIATEIRRVR